MENVELYYRSLLQPSAALLADFRKIDGDIIVLGAGGKMGPALAELLSATVKQLGTKQKIIAASRFSDATVRENLETSGVQTFSVDLLNDNDLQSLPNAANVLYLAGQKFGTTGNESLTWAMNAYLPGRVAEKFKDARIVVFSTGNVYPLSNVLKAGLDETHPPQPLGEYGQSCLGRERVFEYMSKKNNTPIVLYRLNYAIDLSYGVLREIANKVWTSAPIDLRMGHVNVIWQADANEMAIRSLLHCSAPATIFNITGPETASVEWIAEQFAKLMQKVPVFVNEPANTALLSNAAKAFGAFGYPRITLSQMIEMLAAWVMQNGAATYKPTHFQEREGRY